MIRSTYRSVLAALPAGGSLPPETWRRRHCALVRLLWAHVAFVPLFATLQGHSLLHSLLDTAPIAACALGASVLRLRSQRLRGALVALGLITSSAVIVHLAGGVIEAHFHFFVVLSLLILYEAWWPFLIALAYVVVHHGVLGTLAPESVYAHAAAQQSPWQWAGIHAGFVAAASAANIVNWKLNEAMRREARRPAEERLARVEEQLLQSQKMEAVGQLAGGVAHDFNNLLTAIGGYGELLADRLPDDPRVREPLAQMVAAGDRAAALTQQLLAFSRRQVLRPKIIDPNTIVADTEAMLRRLIDEDIEIVTRLDPDLGTVRTDPNQIEQVLVNMAVNARDAMPAGGRLEIETRNVELGEGEDGALAAGSYVRLSVADDGVGMDAVTREHVFEPFFTTKEPGRGTGLGLSTVYGIVRQSGGAVRVESSLYGGSVFRIFLPRQVEDVGAAASPSQPAAVTAHGAERVLLVEDEHVVRALVREALTARGYDVVEADTPEAALVCAEAERFDLVVTDVVMPRMNGPELVRQLLTTGPHLRVLYISGYTREAIDGRAGLTPGTAFLQRPFTMGTLATAVRTVLDEPGLVA